ncbi:MAG: hypothetical protein GX469_06370 [Treponema sp.]|nr:hypothetical protein [Treponema sp.]
MEKSEHPYFAYCDWQLDSPIGLEIQSCLADHEFRPGSGYGEVGVIYNSNLELHERSRQS